MLIYLLFNRSVVSDSATSRTAACQAFLSFTISRSLLKLMCIESMMPSNHLILCRPLLLLPSVFSSIRVFSNESVLCIRWPKYWFQHQSFQTIFRVEAQIYQKERPVQPLVWQRQRKTRRRMCGRGSRLCSVQLTGMGTGSATVGVV